ncbi:MAG: hypothetical protein P4L33_12035 [Capsulimonadaceae bacterium]|nr:hypothetical protein [Capsulimonadaceae bacterium]
MHFVHVMNRSIAAALIAMLGLAAVTASSAKATPQVVITTRSDARAATISPLLAGSQFNFFATPIKQRLNSPGLLDSWRDAHIELLRYPGGTWGDHYVWDHPDLSYFAVPYANAKTIITPEEFVRTCRAIGAEPIFQVNMACTGHSIDHRVNPTKIDDIREGAQWAAGWVREANIKNGWHVKYWELGNEVWIWLRPDEYARAVAVYSDAMRAVDPSIKIIACGLSSKAGPFNASWLAFPGDPNWKPRTANSNEPDAWNKALFSIASGKFDYLAPHPYVDYKGGDAPRDVYLGTVKQVWENAPLEGQAEILKASGTRVKLAITEWSCNFSRCVSAKGGLYPPLYFYTLGNGINVAHYLGRIIDGGQADLAVLHSLDEIQTLYYWPKKELAKTPLDHGPSLALALWGNHLGSRRLVQSVAGSPDLTIDGKAYPGVFLYASEAPKFIYLMAINLDPDASRTFVWRHEGARLAKDGELSLVTGPALDSDNWASWDQPTALLHIDKRSITQSKGMVEFSLPPFSMAGVTLTKVTTKAN